MTLVVTHSKVSSVPDGTDPSVVRPSDWNANHALAGVADLAQGGTGASTAPAAMANLMGLTSTATAAGTTTLTSASTFQQLFTGSTTQTVVLPAVTTLTLGWSFEIENNSTGNITVNSSGGNLVATVIPGTTAIVTCILITGTTAASWNAEVQGFGSVTGTGACVLANSPTLVSPALGTPASGNLVNCSDLRFVPTGAIEMFGGATTPSGWLLCDGSAVSRTTYAALFTAIGTAWGAGDGSTTFNVPNMQDRVPMGKSATKALGSTGGSATATPAGTVSITAVSGTVSVSGTVGSTTDTGTIGGTTLSVAQMAYHNHTIFAGDVWNTSAFIINDNGGDAMVSSDNMGGGSNCTFRSGRYGTDATGGNGTHTHSLTMNAHTHSFSGSGSFTFSSGTASFAGSSMSILPPYGTVNFIIKT